ncbi:MAG: DedA family protein [Nitrososphaeria archaeon]|nr:DedA family protein [Nitrososphaeria archaeon]NDB87682.1 DedA family protein [Nitrososphaerota archaeon]NDF27413.1 DedA family protein [Nitrosopumilaceae archaeon]NDB47070.1 DedA family protein [Nitrososphaeria archaeon]NDB90803.1 DedA family protein [Nitrososphaerota archaeon]
MDLSVLFPFADDIGYVGLALVSFFGSLIPFIPLPSFIFLATMAVEDKFNIHYLVLIAAITSTVAKQIIFLASYEGRKIITEKTRKRMKPFERLVKRYGAAAAFVAAATPIPDDLIYVPLGLAKYNPWRFFVSTLAGKIVLCYAIVLIAHFFGMNYVNPFLENVKDPNVIYVGFGVFVAIMLTAVLLVLRMDWEKILGRVAPWTVQKDED